MDTLTPRQFDEWVSSNRLRYDSEKLLLSFSDEEYLLRVPIGDYHLQLDFRINAALSLLPNESGLLLCRRNLHWESDQYSQGPLDTVLRGLGIAPLHGVVHLSPSERQLAFVVSYLTNRWGKCNASTYIVPASDPHVMLYAAGADTASLFVFTRTLETHEQCVQSLTTLRVPAYGRHIKRPIPLPTYEDIQLESSVVKVDPTTGKPIGPGSDESVLLPEFLPPNEPQGKKRARTDAPNKPKAK